MFFLLPIKATLPPTRPPSYLVPRYPDVRVLMATLALYSLRECKANSMTCEPTWATSSLSFRMTLRRASTRLLPRSSSLRLNPNAVNHLSVMTTAHAPRQRKKTVRDLSFLRVLRGVKKQRGFKTMSDGHCAHNCTAGCGFEAQADKSPPRALLCWPGALSWLAAAVQRCTFTPGAGNHPD